MTFPFNFIIIPGVIIATAVVGNRYVKRGFAQDDWYKHLKKPTWTPSGRLIGEIWTFLYVLTGLAILWYWDVPVFTWFHYVVAAILLVNAYLNATWNKIFFVEHDLPKALKTMKILNGTTILVALLISIPAPISCFLLLPYIAWVGIATRLTSEIITLNTDTKN
ncbi:MAG TPA: tryptophan-rich sensory protein [Patescibacteria group bacterium]|jgi:tryptophan-rich sensory protein|nr:tryptophan-rich sensory protein [Patescibacteria group bacterium]